MNPMRIFNLKTSKIKPSPLEDSWRANYITIDNNTITYKMILFGRTLASPELARDVRSDVIEMLDASYEVVLDFTESYGCQSFIEARFVCVLLAIAPDGTELIARGEVTGHIANEISPVKGFAYDRLFIPTGYTQTFSELGLDVKAQISHRARAASDLLGQIKKSLA